MGFVLFWESREWEEEEKTGSYCEEEEEDEEEGRRVGGKGVYYLRVEQEECERSLVNRGKVRRDMHHSARTYREEARTLLRTGLG